MARRDALGTITDDARQVLAERAKPKGHDRKRKRYPTEDKRAGRVIGPTLSAELIDRLREICAEAGYVASDGQGQIASPIIEDLLWYAVNAYDAGELRQSTEATRHRLAPDGGDVGNPGGE